MPFCTSCGTAVSERAAFCQNCGRPQPVAGVPPATGDPLSGMSAESVSTLCYLPWVGWILSLVVLATNRFRNDGLVRFHAFQGMYLAVVWLVLLQLLQLHQIVVPPSCLTPRAPLQSR